MQPRTGTLSTRKSYLDLTPVDVSLTAGTNIPPPEFSPLSTTSPEPNSSHKKPRPPTAGGGPLSSHPTTPEDMMPGAFPPSPEADKASGKASQDSAPRVDSFREQQSRQATPERSLRAAQHKQPRRLFSLTNLRHSFGSSRSNLRTETSSPAPPTAAGSIIKSVFPSSNAILPRERTIEP